MKEIKMKAKYKKKDDVEVNGKNDGEAGEWFGFVTEVCYARLGPRDWHKRLPHYQRKKPEKGKPNEKNSLFIPGPGKRALAKLPASYWSDIRRTFVERLLKDRRFIYKPVPHRNGEELPQPGVPGSNNWITIGPSVVRKGQATANPPISGRVTRLAIAPGGNRAYVATADGGVWRSDDAGVSWRSTMDGFDLDPTAFAATSSACGAIAIDPADPDRVYVGTGEGDTNELFAVRTVSALPCYRGIGPIRSDDGGATWNAEPTAATSPTLTGSAFFELAVDPGDRENVVGATNVGLYRREPDGVGGYHWAQKRTGVHTSVIACRVGAVTTFFAAAFGGGVFSSPDGDTWTAAGTGFPAAAGRITLGARGVDPSVVYAIVASGSSFLGLVRLDGGTGPWRNVSGLPALGGQADYNLPIAVDPNDEATVYLAGSAFGGDGSIFRCAVTSVGSTFSMATTFIGTGVHADVHVLLHAPGDSSTLWTGCDGGVFRTTTATGAGTFTHRNTGLATLSGNFFSQHPTQLAVILLGLQDNGTVRYTGEECWKRVFGGDGGYPLINWANPNKVLAYANGAVRRATDGGQGPGSFTTVLSPAWVVMAEPLVGTPYKPASPSDAETVAFGAGTSLFISTDFGASWGAAVATLPQNIFALTFVSPTRLYLGTTLGQVHRFDKSGTAWGSTRLDNVAAGPLPLAGIITDIEVDPADATGKSVYITFGGTGDRRHIWHFDGTQWQDRSGPIPAGVLDVEHNAIVADPMNPATLYVGCDVGVWQSTNSGGAWTTLQSGLPDAAVFDLQIHPTARLLRCSTHGRGMFEYKLDQPIQTDVELYVRDTSLDVARASTTDWLADPETWPADLVRHWLSRNIKVDVPTTSGYQTPTNTIDFLTFNDVLVDGSQATATMDPMLGTVVNRVYIEVHNRGIVEATNVQVMLLLANASPTLPALPAGYEANVLSGTPISSGPWQTVGIKTVAKIRAGFPEVVEFNLPSTILPPPASLPGQAHHCLLALVHQAGSDPFTSNQTNVDLLTVADRKVAQRNLELIAFVGTPPPPGTGTWASIELYGSTKDEFASELIIQARSFRGRLGVLLPPDLKPREIVGMKKEEARITEVWAKQQIQKLQKCIKRGRFSAQACRQMILDIRRIEGSPLLVSNGKKRNSLSLSGLQLKPAERYPVFIYFEPAEMEAAEVQEVDVVVREAQTKCIQGGCTYRLVVTPKRGKRATIKREAQLSDAGSIRRSVRIRPSGSIGRRAHKPMVIRSSKKHRRVTVNKEDKQEKLSPE
jgi:hypothetical protein